MGADACPGAWEEGGKGGDRGLVLGSDDLRKRGIPRVQDAVSRATSAVRCRLHCGAWRLQQRRQSEVCTGIEHPGEGMGLAGVGCCLWGMGRGRGRWGWLWGWGEEGGGREQGEEWWQWR